MNRRRFLLLAGGALVTAAAAACGDDGDDTPTATTLPGPGAGSTSAVLLRTGAALSLAAAAVHQSSGGSLAALAASAHRTHVPMLDDSVTEPHPDALSTWATPLDAERALAATFQAWIPVLDDPPQRQVVASIGASVARLQLVVLGDGSVPESFQLTDAAVPDAWLLR